MARSRWKQRRRNPTRGPRLELSSRWIKIQDGGLCVVMCGNYWGWFYFPPIGIVIQLFYICMFTSSLLEFENMAVYDIRNHYTTEWDDAQRPTHGALPTRPFSESTSSLSRPPVKGTQFMTLMETRRCRSLMDSGISYRKFFWYLSKTDRLTCA